MIVLALSISFLVTFFTLPIVIRLFKAINFIDTPDRRKIHKISTPSLGGIAIYFSVLLTMIFLVSLTDLSTYKFFIAGVVVALILGIRDDIASLYANQKLVFQALAAFLAVYYANINLTGFYGLLGFHEIHPIVAVIMSMFMVIALTNAFNLIDGIDGLAGSIALLCASFFGIWFLKMGMNFYSILCFSLVGAFGAFLFFNWQPSKIFMGDTGSLVTGFILSCVAIEFINTNHNLPVNTAWRFNSFLAVAFSLLIIPIYDTFRVFLIRILAGGSPFVPDKKHIHHILLKQGFNHGSSSIILIVLNFFIVAITIYFDFVGSSWLIFGQLIVVSLFGLFFDLRLTAVIKRQRQKSKEERSLYISKSA